MGFLLWAALTLLALAAGLALALRLGARLAIGEQVVAGALTAVTLVVLPSQLLGWTSALYAWTLGPAVAFTSFLVLWRTRPTLNEWRTLVHRLVGALRDSFSVGSIAIAIPASLLLLYLAAYVYLLPSWSWDALWYHNPITAYSRQDHSLRWHDTSIPWMNVYPKNVEILALWNVLFAPDDRLIDTVQLPLSLVGVIALASICRRAGASASLSFGLSLVWLLIPAVFLNIPSNYIDVACAVFWLSAILFLVRLDLTDAHLLFGTVALGLYAGSKFTGAQHAALLLPLVGGLLWRQRGARHVLPRLGAILAAVTLLAGATYARNVFLFGNPFWPYRMKVLGIALPGTHDDAPVRTPPWGGSDNLAALWHSFFEPNPPWMVDVRVGGFGPLFPWVLLPCIAAAIALGMLRARRSLRTPGILAIVVLVTAVLIQPASWWGRFTLTLPAAGLIAVAIILAHLESSEHRPAVSTPKKIFPQLALAGIALFAVLQAWPARIGLYGPPELLSASWRMSPQARASQSFFLWQPAWMSRREDAIQAGDAVAYDESMELLYPLWRFDGANRVLFRPLNGSTAEWLHRLESDRVRWAAIRRGSQAEEALRSAGWTRVGDCPQQQCAMWMRPIHQ